METQLHMFTPAEDIDKNLENMCRIMIGRLLHLAKCTRPDIAFATNYISIFRPTSTKTCHLHKMNMALLKSNEELHLKIRATHTESI